MCSRGNKYITQQVAINAIKKVNKLMLITLHGSDGFVISVCLFLFEMFWNYFSKIFESLLFQLILFFPKE